MAAVSVKRSITDIRGPQFLCGLTISALVPIKRYPYSLPILLPLKKVNWFYKLNIEIEWWTRVNTNSHAKNGRKNQFKFTYKARLIQENNHFRRKQHDVAPKLCESILISLECNFVDLQIQINFINSRVQTFNVLHLLEPKK